MYVVDTRNINSAYERGLRYLMAQGVKDTSRNGPVLVAPGPVTITYKRPDERVLLGHPRRKPNPFLHLAEALWMLAGRRDAAFVGRYAKQMFQYAEDDGNFHGAYGFRWRDHFEMEGGGGGVMPDQLKTIVGLLRKDNRDRRVVLQMWDPVADLGQTFKDLPCNVCMLPRIINGRLDITVINRSNDAIWGAFGTNAVTFSVLQEYLAAQIGVGIGTYYQISNNFHVYEDVLQKHTPVDNHLRDPYVWDEGIFPDPLVDDANTFDANLRELLLLIETEQTGRLKMKNTFLSNTAYPMLTAHWLWKAGNTEEAVHLAMQIKARDWKMASLEWFNDRGGSK